MMRDDTTPPAVEKMSRASDVMPQEDALAYASRLTPSQRMDVGGCYVVRCVPCGLCPVGLHYACGGSALDWGCGTTPFACCALPMPFVDPDFRSLKQDCTVVVVDAAKQTLACYPGERARDPCLRATTSSLCPFPPPPSPRRRRMSRPFLRAELSCV